MGSDCFSSRSLHTIYFFLNINLHVFYYYVDNNSLSELQITISSLMCFLSQPSKNCFVNGGQG